MRVLNCLFVNCVCLIIKMFCLFSYDSPFENKVHKDKKHANRRRLKVNGNNNSNYRSQKMIFLYYKTNCNIL